ncbi:MAG: alpha/beta-type small acid-soluble spore protein [Christensenellales bacterium]|jgi:small acid-soluble spore protein D (minor alpha/beta-type SASP)
MMVPNARQALDNMKFESAKELGVNLKEGDNGDLTARENGSIGGSMVQKMIKQYQDSQSGQSR